MQTKARDELYCGVSEDKIKFSEPIVNWNSAENFFRWVQERYLVHIKKDVLHQDPPWTTYEPLKNNRFTNVRRDHDKESRWLIKNISLNPNLTLEEKILNSILFRTWNKLQFNRFTYAKNQRNR